MRKAVGLIETIGLAAAIEAADAAVKAANVTLLGYENTRGSGKITVKIAGDVGAVKAGVSAAVASASRVAEVYGRTVMARPHEGISSLLQNIDRGPAAPPPAPPKTEGAAPMDEPDVAEEAAAPAKAPDAAEAAADEPTAAALEETPDAERDTAAEVADESEPDRCMATTRTGERCKLPALEGSEYCFVHRKLEEENESSNGNDHD